MPHFQLQFAFFIFSCDAFSCLNQQVQGKLPLRQQQVQPVMIELHCRYQFVVILAVLSDWLRCYQNDATSAQYQLVEIDLVVLPGQQVFVDLGLLAYVGPPDYQDQPVDLVFELPLQE